MGHAGEFEILLMLAVLKLGSDAYGVTIREKLEEETSRRLTLGSIYKTLGRLEEKGYLRCRIGTPTSERGGRRKKYYTLSPAGLSAVRTSLADLHNLASGLDLETGNP